MTERSSNLLFWSMINAWLLRPIQGSPNYTTWSEIQLGRFPIVNRQGMRLAHVILFNASDFKVPQFTITYDNRSLISMTPNAALVKAVPPMLAYCASIVERISFPSGAGRLRITWNAYKGEEARATTQVLCAAEEIWAADLFVTLLAIDGGEISNLLV